MGTIVARLAEGPKKDRLMLACGHEIEVAHKAQHPAGKRCLICKK